MAYRNIPRPPLTEEQKAVNSLTRARMNEQISRSDERIAAQRAAKEYEELQRITAEDKRRQDLQNAIKNIVESFLFIMQNMQLNMYKLA